MSDTTTPDPELPRGIALAWGVAASPQRGPKRELSIERIVDVAVAIADEKGLASVSMSAVAAELGFTTMSLYRYVSAKDDLVLLMEEQGIGVPPESVREAEGWRAGLAAWSHETLGTYLRHPWLLDIPISGTPTTPNNLAWLDAALEVLDRTGLDFGERLSVVLALIAQTRWEGYIARGFAEAAAASGSSHDELDSIDQTVLESLVTPEQLPFVHAAVKSGAFGPGAGGDPFSFGLERVLDGIETYLAGRSPAPAVLPVDEPALRDPKVREAAKARREAEKLLRDARKREREQLTNARERLARQRP